MAGLKEFYDAQARAAGFPGSDSPALDRIGGKRSSRPSSRAFGRTVADLRASTSQRAGNMRAGLDSPGVLALPSRKAWKRMNGTEAPERARSHAKPPRAVRRRAARLARRRAARLAREAAKLGGAK